MLSTSRRSRRTQSSSRTPSTPLPSTRCSAWHQGDGIGLRPARDPDRHGLGRRDPHAPDHGRGTNGRDRATTTNNP